MNDVPDCVCNRELSRSSRNCCTCVAISEPYVAVAIRQPPPCFVLLTTSHVSPISLVPGPHSPNSSVIVGSSNPTAS